MLKLNVVSILLSKSDLPQFLLYVEGVTEVWSDDLGLSSPTWPVFGGMAVHSAQIWKCDLKGGLSKAAGPL